jgi:hypothetical protein
VWDFPIQPQLQQPQPQLCDRLARSISAKVCIRNFPIINGFFSISIARQIMASFEEDLIEEMLTGRGGADRRLREAAVRSE